METVNGLAAPSKQGLADTGQAAKRLQADPWLKIIQRSGCENPNKQDSGLMVGPASKKAPVPVPRPCPGYPTLLAQCVRAGWSSGPDWPQDPPHLASPIVLPAFAKFPIPQVSHRR